MPCPTGVLGWPANSETWSKARSVESRRNDPAAWDCVWRIGKTSGARVSFEYKIYLLKQNSRSLGVEL